MDPTNNGISILNQYWLVVYLPTPLKNDGVKVSWDVDVTFPIDGKINHVPNHQPVILYIYITDLGDGHDMT